MDACSSYYQAKLSLIRAESKILIPGFWICVFYEFDRLWQQNSIDMADFLSWSWWGYPWQLLVFWPICCVAEFFPEAMTFKMFDACNALFAALTVWSAVNNTWEAPLNLGFQWMRNFFMIFQTFTFGNASLNVRLYFVINCAEAILRAWLEGMAPD